MIKLVSWILRMVTGFFSLFILIWTIIGAFWLATSSTCKGKDPTAYRMQVRLCPVFPFCLFPFAPLPPSPLRACRSASGGARNHPRLHASFHPLSLHLALLFTPPPSPHLPFSWEDGGGGDLLYLFRPRVLLCGLFRGGHWRFGLGRFA